jgi:molybdopterin synthase sulfur carrier subunit
MGRLPVEGAGLREEAPLPTGKIPDMALVRYFAAVKEAAGVPSDEVDAGSLAEALAAARQRHSERFTTVLARCSFVVDGDPVGGRDHAAVVVHPESTVDALPPFAGG